MGKRGKICRRDISLFPELWNRALTGIGGDIFLYSWNSRIELGEGAETQGTAPTYWQSDVRQQRMKLLSLMTSDTAIDALSALAHPGRLAVFRLLVRAGPQGIAAGEVARLLDTPPNTMSTQLAILSRTGLIGSRREARSVIYHADYGAFSQLLGFLVEDCCNGRPEVCSRLADVVQSALACATETAVPIGEPQ